MAVIDVDGLLTEIAPDSPCGDNLEYDPEFGDLERASQGREAHQMGDAVIDGEGPDWGTVKKLSLSLFRRTRDLRVATHLTRALTHTDGFPGLADGLQVVKGLIEKYWEHVHPLLDPEDDNDPTFRINTIVSLVDKDTMLRALREAELVSHKGLGRFSLKDIEIARGEIPAPQGVEAPSIGIIDGAFQETPTEDLQAIADAVDSSATSMREIEDKLTEIVGSTQAPDLSEFGAALKAIQAVLADQLGRRGIATAPPQEEGAQEGGGTPGAAGGAQQPLAIGVITSREDAVRTLDKVIEYFNKYEPSSPIPLLLHRAKRLVSKSFIEIMQDLAPDGLAQAQMMGGVKDSQ